MTDEMLRIADGQSYARFSPAGQSPVQALVLEISRTGLLLEPKARPAINSTVELVIELKGLNARQFVGVVTTSDSTGVRLRWHSNNPTEQTRLSALIEAYKTLHPPATPAPRPAEGSRTDLGTRRLVRPKHHKSTVELFPEAVAAAEAARQIEIAKAKDIKADIAPEPEVAEGESGRVGTRRVVRPSAQNLKAVPDQKNPSDLHLKPVSQTNLRPFSDGLHLRPPPAPAPPPGAVPVGAPPSSHGTAPPPFVPPNAPAAPAAEEDAEYTPGRGNPVIGQDGRMDISATLRSKARTVSAQDLAKQHDKVRVLNFQTIRELITDAVEEAAAHLTRALGEQDRKRLLEEAEEGFKERLKAFQQEKASAEEKAKALHDQLAAAQRILADERKRTIKADQFTVSSTSIDEIEAKFKRLLDHSVAEGRVVATLEEELRKVIATVFDSERARIREQEMGAQNDKIELLEKKIKRLAGSLEDTERQRNEAQEWAKMLESQGGGALRNVFTAGLKEGDPNKKRKLALMKEILDFNRAMRKDIGIETKPISEEDAAAIAKAEAETKLTAEDQAQLLEQRKAAPSISERDQRGPSAAERMSTAAEQGGPAPGSADAGIAAAAVGDAPEAKSAEDELSHPDNIRAKAGMQRLSADGVEEVVEGMEIDPDDLPWEPPAATVASAQDDGGIKKIATSADFKLPPLERKSG
jgi:hypothetical protein